MCTIPAFLFQTLMESLEEGGERLAQATKAGEITLPSTSASGQTKIRQELQMMTRDFEDFRTHLIEAQQDLEVKDQLCLLCNEVVVVV